MSNSAGGWGVKAGVFAALAGVAVAALTDAVRPACAWVGSVALALWQFLAQPIGVPLGWLLVGGLVCTALLGLVLWVWRRVLAEPTSEQYTQGHYQGLVWRWDWPLSGYTTVPFCPRCDMQLRPVPCGTYDFVPRIALKCLGCGYDAGTREGTSDELVDLVILEIGRDVRTGRWKTLVADAAGQ